MISKKLFPIIIFIYFFQYVRERNLNYFNFQKVSKKNVLMHRPSIRKSLIYTQQLRAVQASLAQLAKFSVGHSIPFNDFHGNIVQVCLSIKQKHVGFLTPLAKLDKMSVGFLTPLGSVGLLTPLGSVGFLTPLSSVGFLTPLGSVGFLTPFSCRPWLTFQPMQALVCRLRTFVR